MSGIMSSCFVCAEFAEGYGNRLVPFMKRSEESGICRDLMFYIEAVRQMGRICKKARNPAGKTDESETGKEMKRYSYLRENQ